MPAPEPTQRYRRDDPRDDPRDDGADLTAPLPSPPLDPAAAPRDEPPPGARIGRYVVEDVLGRGGMGLVVRAHDPTLERTVAIKLVRGRPDPERLLREARALAQLDHPCIIDVYDAGRYEGGVFIAIEYFEGEPMSRWLAPREPGIDALVDLFLRLADALRSAHAAGIVHRDVKPHNVLIDVDTGALRVVDFGLARSYGPTGASEPRSSPAIGPASLDAITRDDWVVGTPPYMAPEVLMGEPPSREGDAWALGVTLYEALHGQRPFRADTPTALCRQMQAPVPISPHVPRALRRALRGLLEPRVRRRWTLDRAYGALRRYRFRRRRRGIGLGVVGLVGGGALAGALAFDRAACPSQAVAAHAVWSEAARTDIESAYTGAAAYGDQAWARLRPEVEARVEAWLATRDRACDRAIAPAPGADRPRVFECLDRHLGALEATVATLRQPTPMLVARTDELIERLPDPAECADPRALERLAPVPEARLQRRVAAQLRAELTTVSLLRIAGRLDDARSRADALRTEAAALGDPPLLAESALEQGRVYAELHRHQPAESAFREALRLGLRPNYLRVRAEAALALAEALGRAQKRFSDAREVLKLADALVQTLGDPGLVARLGLTRAQLQLAAEDFEEARAAYERLLATGDDRLDRGDLLHGLAASLVVDDRPRALTVLREARAQRSKTYGPTHPRVADTLVLLGRLAGHDGRWDEATTTLHRARTMRAELFGEASTAVAEIDSGLGSVAVGRGDLEAAQRHLEAALAVLATDPNGIDFDLTATRSTLGIVYARRGRFEDALREHRAAMELVSSSAGPRHRRMALPLLNIASTYRRMGRLADAIEWQRKAIAANSIEYQRAKLEVELAEMLRLDGRPDEARAVLLTLGAQSPEWLRGLVRLGLLELDLDAGRRVTLEPIVEQIREGSTPVPEHEARLRFVKARLAWRAHRPAAARALARAALALYGTGVEAEDFDQRRVRAWLEAHPAP